MKVWNNYWYGPVAAVRPYLLLKGVLILLALDVCYLRIAQAAVFYDDRFHAAHFLLLEHLLPVPTPSLYVGVVLLTGLLSLASAFVGTPRVVLVTLFVLYTYTWSVTRLDLYQHHYLLSLVLLCLIFFPRIRAADLHTASTTQQMGLGMIKQAARTRTSAWGFAILGVSIAIVYTYTAIAKLDPVWLSGHTLQSIDGQGALSGLFANLFAMWDWPMSELWSFMAAATVCIELIIATGYLTAVRQDGRSNLPLRLGYLALWLVAIFLHLSFEFMQLKIGWFSYYMILITCAYFLPATWLCVLGALVIWPARQLTTMTSQWNDRLTDSARRLILIGLTMVVTTIVMLMGKAINLPGSTASSVLMNGGLLVVAAMGLRRGSSAPTRRMILATGIAAVVMWGTIANSAEQFEFHGVHAVDLERRNRFDEAIDAKRMAEHYAPEADPRLAPFHTSFGNLLDAQHQFDEAVQQYRKALQFQPDHVEARVKLGLALASADHMDEAVDHLRKLVDDQPDSALSLNALAWILATHTDTNVADPATAVHLALRAAELTGHENAAILDTLAAAYASAGHFEKAVHTAQKGLHLARPDFSENTIREFEERLQLYSQAKPYQKSAVGP